MPDLITSQYATQRLSLSAAQLVALPGTIAAASTLVRNHTARYLSARTSDILITPPAKGPILLPDYPIIDVDRVSTTPRPVFTVANIDPVTNQRAGARMTRTGDEQAGYSATGLRLERVARGVRTLAPIAFTDLAEPTLADLAAAVVAAGGGWTARVTPGFELWGVSELWSGQGAQGALGRGAEFLAWTLDPPFRRDDAAGLIFVDPADDDPFRSMRWGPLLDLEFADDDIRGEYQGVRVTYTAGYATTPDDLAEAVVEIVKAIIERRETSSTLVRETIDEWDVQMRDVIHGIPPQARDTLAYYRDHAR